MRLLRMIFFALTHRCPWCLSTQVSEPDFEGVHDCFSCGSFFFLQEVER